MNISLKSFGYVTQCSDFIARSCAGDADLRAMLDADLERGYTAEDFVAHAPRWQDGVAPLEADFMAALRRWRRREMVRIAWRDLTDRATLEQTLHDLSGFADAAITLTYRYAFETLRQRYGTPRAINGEPQELLVVAMGKLGGCELNFSSDIDLVFLFPEHGETDGARAIANEEFFTRLGQSLNRLLATPTSDGFVFRVDLRLRPFGDSGPLVASFASFEDYLLRHGREWERYAWVKARAITARERFADVHTAAIRPFVYRRYLDYGVFESLREMKALIEQEVQRRELANDIKLGPGGIREIEFIVQAFQLIRGAQDVRLQTPSLLQALPLLDGAKLLPAAAVTELRDAYIYLRRLENRLQMFADEQTHRLPQDDSRKTRIALAMGAPDWTMLEAQLRHHRERVREHFAAVFQASATAHPAQTPDALEAFFADYPDIATLHRRLDQTSRKRLRKLLLVLLEEIACGHRPEPLLRRVLKIIEAIGQRSVYFALLFESERARKRLVELCEHGDFLVDQIAAYPLLLDELVDERLLQQLPDRASLARDLELVLQQLGPEQDPEQQVEALCRFQRTAIFKIAVADLTSVLPVMKVSDRLTDVAELILERAMQFAWQQITAQYGTPMCDAQTEPKDSALFNASTQAHRRPVRVCAAGYGKLGGMELGYSSDLDLVFLHDSHGEHQETDAILPDGSSTRAIDNQVFFVRLAQRIVHLLTMHSAAGRLYEVDVRLRPSGKGGMLVTNIRAFQEYQRKEAWTWEHQALLHARAVAGSPELRAQFEALRLEVLMHDIRRDTLRDEVRNMRERMRRELSRSSNAGPGAALFDIKQDAGGITDIEFLAQYWALKWAREYPPVAMFSDTIRQLESVASAALVPQAGVDELTFAYRAYRARAHHLSLQGREAVVPIEEFTAERAAVMRIWNRTFTDEGPVAHDLSAQ